MRIFIRDTHFTRGTYAVLCVGGTSSLQACLLSQVRDSSEGSRQAVTAGSRHRAHVRNNINTDCNDISIKKKNKLNSDDKTVITIKLVVIFTIVVMTTAMTTTI